MIQLYRILHGQLDCRMDTPVRLPGPTDRIVHPTGDPSRVVSNAGIGIVGAKRLC
jgi:hypothetical protein